MADAEPFKDKAQKLLEEASKLHLTDGELNALKTMTGAIYVDIHNGFPSGVANAGGQVDQKRSEFLRIELREDLSKIEMLKLYDDDMDGKVTKDEYDKLNPNKDVGFDKFQAMNPDTKLGNEIVSDGVIDIEAFAARKVDILKVLSPELAKRNDEGIPATQVLQKMSDILNPSRGS